jgi:chitinase
MIGVYFESWACPWTDVAEKCRLAEIEKPIDTVMLSFVRPDCTYRKSQETWAGTGMDFSVEFKVVKKAIQILKQKGIKVLLAVGGATYQFDIYDHQNVAHLMMDLGVDGIDLDWEPARGIQDASQFEVIIEKTKPYCKDKLLSAAVFAYGVMQPQKGNPYMGVNTQGLLAKGYMLDFINVMAYDGGKNLDVSASYSSYKTIFSKPILMGFQVGKQGWGDAYLTLEDVVQTCSRLQPGDGCFVWAYFKEGTPNCKEVIQTASKTMGTAPSFYCPHCASILYICTSPK